MNDSDEFYIGWENRAPTNIGRIVRRVIVVIVVAMVLLAGALALVQRTIGVSVFEWGTVKTFTGILKAQPYPHLLVTRPGTAETEKGFSSYYLVKPFKFGVDPKLARELDGKPVTLKGTLIYRGDQTMIELIGDSMKPVTAAENTSAAIAVETSASLGEQTLTGEIVDSKCWLGVMNPGALLPHRACAIRCISGGIPPILLVRQKDGPALHFLLVSRDGQPVNQQVLDLVAEPVQITGEVTRQGELLVLRADPGTFRRVGR